MVVNNQKIKVSIIVPIYNVEKYLRKCIDSIINQTYNNLEIILIDDGSSDNCPAICDEYVKIDKRINVIHKGNEGVSAARNTGIRVASGDYITFADSDDWLDKNALTTMLNIAEKESVECVRTTHYFNCPDSSETKWPLKSLDAKKYEKEEVHNLLHNFIVGDEQCYVWLLLIRNDLLNTVGGFNHEICIMEDTIFYVRLLSNVNSIFLSDEPTYHYLQNNQSATHEPSYYPRNANNILLVNKEIKKILQDKGLLSETLLTEINLTHITAIVGQLFLMYRNGCLDAEMHELFLQFHNNIVYRGLVNGLSLGRNPYRLRYAANYILNNQYSKMLHLFEIRLALRNLRNFILRRSF